MKNDRPIHLWAPGMFQELGGIQRFSRHLLSALETLRPEDTIAVSLKNDTTPDPTGHLPSTRFSCYGEGNPALRTLRFSTSLLTRSILERPRLILSTHIHFAPLSALCSALTGAPHVLVAHGVEAWSDTHRLLLPFALRSAKKILSVSRYTADRLAESFSIPQERIALLPNTYAEERFTPGPKSATLMARYRLHATQPVILTLSRLDSREQYKGYDKILEVFGDLRRVIPDLHYLIAGDGDDRERIEYLIRKLGLEECVTLVGRVSEEELADHYRLCDLFAMPSSGEGFGIVFLEAAACGKPVLAGNRDGSVDAVRDGAIGKLIDPFDREEIVHGILSILTGRDPHRVLYDPNELHRQVRSHFGKEAFRARFAQILDTL